MPDRETAWIRRGHRCRRTVFVIVRADAEGALDERSLPG